MGKKLTKLLKDCPREIRSFMTERNVVANEDAEEYDNLLVALIEVEKPKTTEQWLDVKEAQDLKWEQFRMRRIKTGILDSAQVKAVTSLLNTLPPELQNAMIEGVPGVYTTNQLAGRRPWDEKARKSVDDVFEVYGFITDTINAVAFMAHSPDLALLDRMETSNGARQFANRRLREEQRVLDLQANEVAGAATAVARLEHKTSHKEEEISDLVDENNEEDLTENDDAGEADDHEEVATQPDLADEDADSDEEGDDAEEEDEEVT